MTDEEFLMWLIEEQHYMVPMQRGDRWTALRQNFDPSIVILMGKMHDEYSWTDEWAYADIFAAISAYAAWNGEGEPANWIRHKPSNRRRATSDDEVDQDGRRVKKGEVYVRP